MLQRPNTRVISIDLGYPIDEEIVHGNVDRLNKFNNLYSYLKGNSQTQEMVNKLKTLVDEIDILFIDGDHSYQGVINDFTLYEGIVKKGGYIVFDDYSDPSEVHNTSKAVNHICNQYASQYNIIGAFPNLLKARPDSLLEGNDFIIQKI